MLNVNVNDQDPNQVYQGVPTQSTTQVGPVSSTTSAPTTQAIDTIQPSQGTKEQTLIDSANPVLVPPIVNLNNFAEFYSSNSALKISNNPSDLAIQVAMQIEQKNHEIITNMLDSWIENQKKLEKEYNDKINSPAYQEWIKLQSADYHAAIQRSTEEQTQLAVMATPEYQMWVLSQMSPAQLQAPEAAFNRDQALKVGVINGLDNYMASSPSVDSEQALSGAFVASSAILGASLLATPVTPELTTDPISYNPIQDQWQYVSPLVPSNMAAELGLIGGLFAAGVMYRATLNTISDNAGGGGSKPLNLDFAQKYSEQMLKLVASPSFSQFVRGSLVDKLNGADTLTDARKDELASILKAVLLSSALATHYKIEAGKNTSQEFLSMIRGDRNLGDIVFPDTDVRAKLIKAIQTQLDNLSDPAERSRVLEAIGEYMDTDPSTDKLLEPQSVFQDLLTTTPYADRLSKEHV
ncbi:MULTISPECIES: hypothetical protein [Parachlamydia]|jgi:hypothetical protein|uniref:hypothetical protein n=1 Tax=Parachlamydia TaxID=83551 RepID=UPI0001C1798F|nr:hypothetical protein [Parachlamydia acanthamoebae]EFB40486.1 hypothetical protein pah_c200o035 [Parachlamydia acanthamoebae str. Hall's coccus]